MLVSFCIVDEYLVAQNDHEDVHNLVHNHVHLVFVICIVVGVEMVDIQLVCYNDLVVVVDVVQDIDIVGCYNLRMVVMNLVVDILALFWLFYLVEHLLVVNLVYVFLCCNYLQELILVRVPVEVALTWSETQSFGSRATEVFAGF